MGKVAAAVCKYCLVGFGLLVAVSCNTRRNIPFPAPATEFQPPVTRSFQWPAPVKIKWITTKADTIAPPVQHVFDMEKIPARPFFFDGFTIFATPPATEKIDWANLPSENFSTDTIPATKLVYKTIKITAPIRIKSGIPKTKNPVTRNIVHFGQDEGLPGGTVQQIYQDKKGVFWIATGRGLCRYDGEYFELYSFIGKEPQGSIQVRQLAEDKAGHIWIRTDSRGIYVYNYAAETVVNIEKGAYDFCMGNDGLVWTLNYNGEISLVDPVKLTAQKMSAGQLSASGKVARVLQGNGQQLLFRTAEGIRVLDRQKKKIFNWNSKSIPADNLLFYFLQTTDGHLLTKTESSVDVLDPAAGTLQHFTTAQGLGNIPFLFNPTEDNNGHVWQARADSGMEVLDMKRNALLKIGKADGLSEAFITCAYSDRDGKMWIGTNSGGINIIDNTIAINHLSVNQGLSDNSIWSMLEDGKGQVWFGSSAGTDVLNMEAHTIKNLSSALQLPAGYSSLPRLANGKHGEIWSYSYKGKLLKINPEAKTVEEYDTKNLPFRQTIRLMVDHSGMIWINTFNDGVLLFNPQNNTFRHINAGNGLAGNLAWRLLEDKDNRIWVATSKGLSMINEDRTTVVSWRRGDGLSDDITQALVQDSAGRIWVSTNEGVDLIDIHKKTLTAFARKQGLAENESYALEYIGGKIYAGTSSGISIIENTSEQNNPWRISSFARAQGLYYLDVNSNASLLTSKGKIIWGIQQVATIMDQPRKDSAVKPAYITAVTINGRQQHFYNTREATIPDTVWSEAKDTFYTKENVAKIFAGEKDIQWKTAGGLFNMPDNLQLHYNQNQLSFQFTGLQTANKDKVRYCYILEGLDEQWSKVTDIAQSPDYNNLSAGDYTFKVCSKAANGIWSTPAELHFSILPPWWKSWWAYALYALVFAALIRAYVLYRSRLLTKENVLLEEKVHLRTSELKQSLDSLQSTQAQLIQSEKMASLGELTAGIAHEIQNPLNFVNNFSEVNKELLAEMNDEIAKGNYDEVKLISKDITDNEEKINHHGKRADAIVKGMLQHSRSSSAVKEPADINKLADEYLRLAYHGLRAKDKSFNAALHTDFDETIGLVNIVPQNIGRVILNLITNAFYAISAPTAVGGEKGWPRPGYEPAVWVSTKKQGNKVAITVKDNGSGIPPKVMDKIFQPFFTTKPTGQGTGLGLSLSYDIVKAHGGDLTVDSKEGDGTAFTITLPLA